MSNRENHLRQARDNLAFARRLLATFEDDPTAMQWAVTAAFYCALHALEAHLLRHGERSRNHHERLVMLRQRRFGVPPEVYTAYRQLKWRSEGARYHLWQFRAETVREVVLGRLLARVTAFVDLERD